jgi:hypothetical protein
MISISLYDKLKPHTLYFARNVLKHQYLFKTGSSEWLISEGVFLASSIKNRLVPPWPFFLDYNAKVTEVQESELPLYFYLINKSPKFFEFFKQEA